MIDHPPAREPDRRIHEVPSPLGLTMAGFADLVRERSGLGPGRAREAYQRLFRDGDPSRCPMPAPVAPIVRRQTERTDEGLTVKFVQRLPRPHAGRLARDGRVTHLDIESVVIPMVGRTRRLTHTLCVSSQVGCAMGCGFCETAQMGLVRSLTAAEIVGQWHAATHAEGATIRNIVFMGMGEPLDNAEAVAQAIRVLTDHHGPAVPASKITVSTVGRTDGLRLLGELMLEPGLGGIGLAVSVNAPNDAIRSGIMPVNRAMPMGDLRETLLGVPAFERKKICFEYVLIPGVNDAPEHAAELAAYLEPFGSDGGRRPPRGLVNVIPYNPRRDSPWPAPEETGVDAFVGWLRARGVFVKRRRTKGRSMMGACGQLGAAEIRGRRFVPISTPSGGATPA